MLPWHSHLPLRKDDFRHLRGFQTLLDVLRSFSGFYNPQKRSQEERRLLRSLAYHLSHHLGGLPRPPGNRRYFQHRVEGGGWEALEQIIASIGVGGSDSDLWTNCQLFGKLLSFSLDDQRVDELCREVADAGLAREDDGTPDGSGGKGITGLEDSAADSDVKQADEPDQEGGGC